ncbi:MAG: DUF3048 domain-containing protein [Anaerolineaceae bacterium]|nr:DUF3048 domain-containing protein [Anaerolineaceae bacterium]
MAIGKGLWVGAALLLFLLVGCQAGKPPQEGSSPLNAIEQDIHSTTPADQTTSPKITELAPPTILSTSVEEFSTPTAYATPLNPSDSFPQSLIGLEDTSSEINPLTGLPVGELWRLDRRPVMVKVSNSLNVRPQSGLSFADLVFDYYIGEGTNRFLAVFYGQDVPQAGPIRSGRMVDSQLVSMYHGILAYGSADPRVDKILIRELGDKAISHLEIGCPIICGADTHSNPGVYGNTFELTQYSRKLGIEEKRQALYGMFFNPDPPEQGDYALQIAVQYAPFNRGEWRYNPDLKRYNRWIDNKGDAANMIPLTDRLTGNQVSAANVIILFTEYVEYNPTLHNIKVWDNQQGQRALFFRDGIYMDGTWRVPAHDQPLQFYNRSGLPMLLKPGNTWIILAGNSSTFSTTAPGVWEMRVHLP